MAELIVNLIIKVTNTLTQKNYYVHCTGKTEGITKKLLLEQPTNVKNYFMIRNVAPNCYASNEYCFPNIV